MEKTRWKDIATKVVMLLVTAMPTATRLSMKRQQDDEDDYLRPVMMIF